MISIRTIYDNRSEISLATKMRRKRFKLFQSLLSQINIATPINVLDVGGTRAFWQSMDLIPTENLSITLLNSVAEADAIPPYNYSIGDGREMKEYRHDEFDFVFSNSVIEHVGSYEDQTRMANEMQRIGKRFFLQTPNKYFPLEPHFLFPFFQFLPHAIKVWLLMHFNMGWMKKADHDRADLIAKSIRLLSKRELLSLFPNASIHKEKFMGLTKSFIVYHEGSVV